MNRNIFKLVILALLAVLALPFAAVAQDAEPVVTDLGASDLKVSYWHGLRWLRRRHHERDVG